MKTTAVLASVLCLTLCALAWGQDDLRRLQIRQEREGIDLSPDWRGVVVDWTARGAQGVSNIYIPRIKDFRVVKLGDFTRAQQEVAKVAGKYGDLQIIRGTPCFVPADDSESNLSVPVTLRLDRVSTWEALKAVIRQVNCNRRFGDRTMVSTAAYGGNVILPDAFDGDKTISLHVDNVPAREAICAVLAQAPLSLNLRSSNLYRPDFGENPPKTWEVEIIFLRGNQPLLGAEQISRERLIYLQREREEAGLPAEDCAGQQNRPSPRPSRAPTAE